MTLKSPILAGSERLERASSGGPSVKMGPPADQPDAVKRIQKGLAALGFPMPRSFRNGPSGEPDGIFGQETRQAIIAFQRREFPKEPGQWDGRVGRFTLGRMDELLSGSGDEAESVIVPRDELATSQCSMRVPPDVA
jgi:peptidoglycan hydrolase-like protein with peptidoglycan-binding domain